jgi:predicted transcriptional regulator with HTH domain
MLFLAAEECKCDTEGSLTSINANYIEKRHLILIGLVCAVQDEHFRVQFEVCQ